MNEKPRSSGNNIFPLAGEELDREKKILAAKIVFDRHPSQPIYVKDLKDLHCIIDHVFIDDPERFQSWPDFSFDEFMGEYDSVVITMEYVTLGFFDDLEEFESF